MGLTHTFRPLHYDAILDLNGSYTMPSEDKRFILILLPNTSEDSDYGEYTMDSILQVLCAENP